ncbi:MAG: hypothetical protein IAE91_12105 [Ignavibacteriaceae bacterium]|nr:hypothetical protein [Ignavibacteriaceae bacterium]
MKNYTKETVLTVLVFVTGFVALYFIFNYEPFLYIALVTGAIVTFFPKVSSMIHKGWMTLAIILGRINSYILLTAIFFVILLPLSIIAKLTKKDPLALKTVKSSYYHDRDKIFVKDDLKNPW